MTPDEAEAVVRGSSGFRNLIAARLYGTGEILYHSPNTLFELVRLSPEMKAELHRDCHAVILRDEFGVELYAEFESEDSLTTWLAVWRENHRHEPWLMASVWSTCK